MHWTPSSANLFTFAHAFGQRYELPIPLLLFVLGGAIVVFISFLLVLPSKIKKQSGAAADELHVRPFGWVAATVSWVLLGLFIAAGLFGSQEVPENILPTVFWLVVWIGVPLSCGVAGDWTQALNPFANLAKLFDKTRVRQMLLARCDALRWPAWLGWWPAAVLFFVIACGELIFNQTATLPSVTAAGLLVYGVVSAFGGLLFGRAWLERGEVFTVLFATWGRLGFFRFGAPGRRRFAGGLDVPFAAVPSRIAFVLLLLVSVSFDGLLSTRLWTHWQQHLPTSIHRGSLELKLLTTLVFALLAFVAWALFSAFALAVTRAGQLKLKPAATLAYLLPSLVPISFGYLLAHNIEYLVVNSQLLFPLIGNPIGKDSWPIHLPNPFNDSFEPRIHLLPSSFYWYLAVVVIVAVHVVAVVIAHQHIGHRARQGRTAHRAEYPWIVAMVGYTMLSLWLLAQPLVKEKPAETGLRPILQTQTVARAVEEG